MRNFNLAELTDNKRLTQSELEDMLFRFEGRFSQLVANATQSLASSPNAQLRRRALENQLNYASAALDIALGPVPEANLLDMVTLVTLSRNALEKHWIPTVFGDEGKPLVRAFAIASADISSVTHTVLDTDQIQSLYELIHQWEAEHPDQYSVERVRLSHFAAVTGAVTTSLEKRMGGLFSDVRRVTQSVDAAILLGERALYASERIPFLMRLHAQLAVGEVMGEAARSAVAIADFFPHQPGLPHLFAQLHQMTITSEKALIAANATLGSAKSMFTLLRDSPQVSNSGIELMRASNQTLTQLNRALDTTTQTRALERTESLWRGVEAYTNRLLFRIFIVGTGLILLFGAVLIAARRLSGSGPSQKGPPVISSLDQRRASGE